MEKILVSACLLGEKCNYRGEGNPEPYLEELNRYYDIVPFCPEVEGGLPTPRKPNEIVGARVLREDGKDVTRFFTDGAYKATAICAYLGISLAILKEDSPSCGVHFVHDGHFKGRKVAGEGMTTAALRRDGVTVLNEEEGRALLEKLQRESAIKDELTAKAKARENEPKAEKETSAPSAKPEKKPYSKDHKPSNQRHFHGQKPGYSFKGKTRPFAHKGKQEKK